MDFYVATGQRCWWRKIKMMEKKSRQPDTHPSLTSDSWIWSICPSARMRRLADSVTILPFLYQVMVGGGTALDSHSRVTDFPARTFTTTGESPLLSLILGGTGEGEQHLPLGAHQWLDVRTAWVWTHWKLWGRCACVLLLQHSWPHSCTFRHRTLSPSESVVSDRLEAQIQSPKDFLSRWMHMTRNSVFMQRYSSGYRCYSSCH